MSTTANPAPSPDRIAQLRQATERFPTDPLGFFSLGRALLDSGDHHNAIGSLQRALALDSKLSKGYVLLSKAQIALDRKDEAVKSLQDGLLIAHQRGDLMVKNEIIDSLKSLGADVPEIDKPIDPASIGEGQVLDRRTGKIGSRMSRQPFKSDLGKLIYDNTSAETWKEWIAMGTKVINELRLPLHDPKANKVYEDHMIDFLNLKDLIGK
jgi:Fe-S cluster biosynthesis and repair protein YggX